MQSLNVSIESIFLESANLHFGQGMGRWRTMGQVR